MSCVELFVFVGGGRVGEIGGDLEGEVRFVGKTSAFVLNIDLLVSSTLASLPLLRVRQQLCKDGEFASLVRLSALPTQVQSSCLKREREIVLRDLPALFGRRRCVVYSVVMGLQPSSICE